MKHACIVVLLLIAGTLTDACKKSDAPVAGMSYCQLKKVTGSTGSSSNPDLTFMYDARGKLIKKASSLDTLSYVYGSNGDMKIIHSFRGGSPDNMTIVYLDALGHLKGSATYNAEGPIMQLTDSVIVQYSSDYRSATLTSAGPDSTFSSNRIIVKFDSIGNPIRISEYTPTGSMPMAEIEISYDNQKNPYTYPNPWSGMFLFVPVNNPLQKTTSFNPAEGGVTSTTTYSYTYTPKGYPETIITRTPDAAGVTTQTLTYDCK